MASHHRLRLPESSHGALRTLLTLSAEQFRQLEQSLRQAKPALWPHKLAEAVEAELGDDAEVIDVTRIVYTLSGLYIARADSSLSISAFVERVREAVEATGNAALKPDDSDWS